ncbi:GDSL esterase/lipase At1g28610-like [Glycine soja]|uniref:GDSL esterase/lipase At1g28610-like n=1 Tax=Glycine soja TaxID=3848 RepID=UPI00103C4C51|nr:GDSL esterase/lipase At1g28610-like [Glycine soja]
MIQTLFNWLSTSENLLVSIQEKIKWADAMSEIEKKHRKDVEEKVQELKSVIKELIEEGAIKLVVPKNFLIGCNSVVLATLNSDKKDDYDQFGCLTTYNTFIEYYNEQIKKGYRDIETKVLIF